MSSLRCGDRQKLPFGTICSLDLWAVRTVLRRAVALCVVAFCVAPVLSGDSGWPTIGASGTEPSDGAITEAHGWFVVPAADSVRSGPEIGPETGPEIDPGAAGLEPVAATPEQRKYILIHLPPRQAALHGGAAGVGRRSRTLDAEPLGIAAAGRRVYVLSGPIGDSSSASTEATDNPASPDASRYIVRSLETWPTPVEGIWADQPANRMESLPSLEVGGEIIGFAASGSIVAVLAEGVGGLSIAWFDGKVWATSALSPYQRSELGSGLHLLASPARFAIAGDAGVGLFEINDGVSDWTTDGFVRMPQGGRAVGLLGRSVVVWRPTADAPAGQEPGASGLSRVAIELCDGSAQTTLATIPVPDDLVWSGVVVIPDGAGRLAFVHAKREEGTKEDAFGVIEVSLSTGTVLYDGPVDPVVPVSAEEFKVLAAALITMMVVSLVIVLRPVPGEGEAVVPDGWAFASPSRRLLATIFDLMFAGLVVARVTGVPFGQIASLSVLVAPDQSWLTLPAVLIVGFAAGSVAESIFSASLGKMAVGCRVAKASVDPDAPTRAVPIGVVGAFARNAVKWFLPPASSLALLEPTGRHRGDMLANAVVIVRIAPEPAGPDARDEP